MASLTQTTDQPRKLSEPLDYATANFITLLLAVIILIAFIFMPWLWSGAKYNGARIMSDVLAGGMLKTYSVNAIVLIPIVGLLVGGLALWGLLNALSNPFF